MNGAHLHLLVNHLPIVGTFLAIPLVGLALWRNKDASLLGAAVLLLTIGAVGAFAADLTGDSAEEVVEHLATVSKAALRVHEDRAGYAEAISGLTAALGIGLLGWRLKKVASVPRAALAGLLGASLISGAAMAVTGAAGGEINHPEIRSAAANAAANSAATEADGDDDEEEAGEAGEPPQAAGAALKDGDGDGDDDKGGR